MGNVLKIGEAVQRTDEHRGRGKRIVFTNGCFDILHAGHIRYLTDAKKFGDVLVVGINSDSSVSSIKEGRPVVPENERAEVVASIGVVDYVVIFEEETPYDIIKALRPDVLVKGGDWDKEDIVGSDIVDEVHSLKYHQGLSTTGIIERIRSLKN